MDKKIKVLFVCHGNICRSPMAEFVMKDLVERRGLADSFEIASAATSSEELGCPVYPPVAKILSEHGIDCKSKSARRITAADYGYYDYIIGMDSANIRNMKYFFGSDKEEKIHLLLDYTNHHRDVADPWYTRDFLATWRDVTSGCEGLLEYLLDKNKALKD